MKSPIEQQD